MYRQLRLPKLNLLLPALAGVLLVISTIFVGIGLFRSTLPDITEEVSQCFSESQAFPRNDFTYCIVDEFTFSESYGQYILAGTFDQLCSTPERKIERIAGVTFTLEPGTVVPTFCSYRVIIQFGNGERFTGGLLLNGGPRPPPERYQLHLANPGSGRPIAGYVYDTETHETFYLVTRRLYG